MFSTLQGRVIAAISFVLLPLILGGALLYASSESRRIHSQVDEQAQLQLRNLVDQLSLIDQQVPGTRQGLDQAADLARRGDRSGHGR